MKVFFCFCACIRMCVCTTYVRHACVRTCVCIVRTYVRNCLHTCVRTCVRMRTHPALLGSAVCPTLLSCSEQQHSLPLSLVSSSEAWCFFFREDTRDGAFFISSQKPDGLFSPNAAGLTKAFLPRDLFYLKKLFELILKVTAGKLCLATRANII